MLSKKNSYIPKVCQENWLQMDAAEKSRFCNLCQKNVFDFSENSTNDLEEIVCLRHAREAKETNKNKVITRIATLLKIKTS